MQDGPDIRIIIVNYNGKEFLRRCLASIYESETESRFQVHVVDNASTDGSAEMVEACFPQVCLTKNRENIGFGKANNQILRSETDARYYLTLNPDIIVTKGSIDYLRAYMDAHENVGISGCKLLNPDLSLQYSCRTWPHPLTILLRGMMVERFFADAKPFRDYYMTDWDHDHATEVDWILGSCLMIRKKTLEGVGFFDENFFMYYEDVDLAMRARENGWGVVYIPDVSMIHHHKQESHNWRSIRVRFQHIRSATHFFRKHKFFHSLLLGRPKIHRRRMTSARPR